MSSSHSVLRCCPRPRKPLLLWLGVLLAFAAVVPAPVSAQPAANEVVARTNVMVPMRDSTR
ncbi:MAG: hypothetical protein ABEK84_07785, partial [Salinibacter sp.]